MRASWHKRCKSCTECGSRRCACRWSYEVLHPCAAGSLFELVEESTVSVRIQVLFYSMYGHIYRMSEAVVEGAREVEGAEVSLYQVAELVPEEALEKIGAKAARPAFGHVPIATPGQLAEADAIIFGTPTRFGTCACRCGTFWTRQGHSGSVGLWSVRSVAFSHPLPPST